MDYDDWKPIYEAILADFGYPKAGDEEARDRLATRLSDRPLFDPGRVGLADSTVAIAGAAPSLLSETAVAEDADLLVAASTAADRLLDAGVDVDLVVTDLDKHADAVIEHTHEGRPVAVHGHGDNVDLIEATVPECDSSMVVPTTQAAPAGPVRNFGGFTDGDRAAFLADHFGAAELRYLGWDFDDDTVGTAKAQKLVWAKRLLYWLERRRDERCSLLDGCRDEIDRTALPVE